MSVTMEKPSAELPNRENALVSLFDEVLKAHIIPCLNITDMLSLRATCKDMKQKVSLSDTSWKAEYSGAFKIGITRPRKDQNDLISVHQIERHKLCMFGKTFYGMILEMHWCVWDEQNNSRDGPDCRPLRTFPLLAGNKLTMSPKTEGKSFLDFHEEPEMTTEEEEKVGLLVYRISMCATFLVRTMQDGRCPLTSSQVVRKVVPSWMLKYCPDFIEKETKPENQGWWLMFHYRPAGTLEEWRQMVPKFEDGMTCRFLVTVRITSSAWRTIGFCKGYCGDELRMNVL